MSDNFDYVIVGAGSAGCVLAARLTEDPNTTVALVEAGGPDKKQEIHIPAAFSKLFKGPCDWAYFTEEQPHLNNRKLYWPRGKVLGGSSSMNAMIYTRGHRGDFDSWKAEGNDGWGADDVWPLFDRVKIEVSELRTKNPLSEAFVRACGEDGISRNDHFNGTSMEGAGFFHVAQSNGRRCSSAAAYLKPVMKRPNLTVFTNTLTRRVLFEGTRAVGVDCGAMQLRANREVILSGGAINSPQLLMLSGIGAADELRKHGIGVVADLPGVGKNLQDHLVDGVTYASTKPVTLAGAETIGNVLRFIFLKKGMLTSNVAEAGAFLRMRSESTRPDIELIFGPTFYMNHGFDNPPGHGFTVGAILMHPKSRGTITLRSTDPAQAPAIDPAYFTEPDDLRLLREGVERCHRIAQAKAFDEFRGGEVWPAERVKDMDDFVRDTSQTLYHPVGTCAMGTVVDAKLRVRGVENLRVVDASVMPTIVTGHPNAAVVAIGERAVELLRG